MGAYVFGKGDRFAVPEQSSKLGAVGVAVAHTRPSYDIFYSEYGFCLPLDYEGIPIEFLLDDKIPKFGNHAKKLETTHLFLRVTPEGALFKTSICEGATGMTVHQFPILQFEDSWWVTDNTLELSSTEDRFIGFLTADPSEEEINKYFHRYVMGAKLKWYSISEIISRYKSVSS